jgi:hypothetical protein
MGHQVEHVVAEGLHEPRHDFLVAVRDGRLGGQQPGEDPPELLLAAQFDHVVTGLLLQRRAGLFLVLRQPCLADRAEVLDHERPVVRQRVEEQFLSRGLYHLAGEIGVERPVLAVRAAHLAQDGHHLVMKGRDLGFGQRRHPHEQRPAGPVAERLEIFEHGGGGDPRAAALPARRLGQKHLALLLQQDAGLPTTGLGVEGVHAKPGDRARTVGRRAAALGCWNLEGRTAIAAP